MKNEPLTSNEHYKLFLFFLLLIPSIILLVGIIPVLALAIGFYLMKKNNDFSSIEASVKAFNIYCFLISIIGLIWFVVFSVMSVSEYLSDPNDWRNISALEFAGISALFAGILAVIFAHVFMTKRLYLVPLRNHSEWVVANGIFSNKSQTTPQASPKHGIDILQSQKLKQYSVADELVKWAKLKEDGHISDDEFDEARSKLLGRS